MPDEQEYREYLDAIEENVSEFEEMYGFKHECHCAEDWDTGDVGLVSKCYTEMVHDALNRCHEYKGEVAELERSIILLQLQVAELGAEPRVS